MIFFWRSPVKPVDFIREDILAPHGGSGSNPNFTSSWLMIQEENIPPLQCQISNFREYLMDLLTCLSLNQSI